MIAVAGSGGLLSLAAWMGVVAVGGTLVLLVLILRLRRRLNAREARRQRLLARWRPIIARCVRGQEGPIPELADEDFAVFGQLWNHVHESLDGLARHQFNVLGRAVGLDRMALERLNGPVGESQLLAILTLGHLREQGAWLPLLDLTRQPDPAVSLTAARALVLLDAEAALPVLAPMIAEREDWTLAKVGSMLSQAGPRAVTLPLINVVAAAPVARQARLIRLLQYAQGRNAMPVVRSITRSTSDPEVRAACLSLLRDRRDVDLAREYLHADDWRVRVQAALALGRAGSSDDWIGLVELLHDRKWWVRYRAAQSLVTLTASSAGTLSDIVSRLTDPFARDIVNLVLAERSAT